MLNKPLLLAPDLKLQIRKVQLQCRRRVWLRCWIRFGLAALALTVIFTVVLMVLARRDLSRNPAIGAFVAVQLFFFLRLMVIPLCKPPTLRQVSLFIDEHHPELENRILSAVEFSEGRYDEASAWLIERFLEESSLAVRRAPFFDLIDRTLVVKLMLAASFFIGVSMVVVVRFQNLWMPRIGSRVQHLSPLASAEDFTVEPGNARVRAGQRQIIIVKANQKGKKATIRWRMKGQAWQSEPMEQGSSERVHYHKFLDIRDDILYQVRVGSKRSEQFKIATWIPPEVRAIDVTYHYPKYLKRKPREAPNSGNITAIEGTLAQLVVRVNKEVDRAELVLASGGRIALDKKRGTLWTGQLRVEQNDRYHIELIDADGAQSLYNPEYDITAQPDQVPTIHIDFPHADLDVSKLEEVPFNFRVSDDFGLDSYGLIYEVAGRDPVRVALQNEAGAKAPPEGSYRLMLEDMNLEPGDLITWTVWAKDKKPGRAEWDELGDPYFLEIRPFLRQFREAVSNGSAGGAQGGGGGEAAEQKDIVISIWNLRRKAASLAEKQYKEQREIISDAQTELLQQTAMAETEDEKKEALRKPLAEAMALTIKALDGADPPDPGSELSEASKHAQTAYHLLLQMEPDESEVQERQGPSGGGAGGNRREMSELELRRNRNHYEQERRTQDEQEAADQTLNKIKELAQRQQMVNEEIARLISELENATTEEQKREIKRKLESLRDQLEKNLEDLDEIQRDVARGEMNDRQAGETRQALNETRDQMNRGLENLQDGRLQQARSAGSRALASLRDIENKLQKLSRSAASAKMQELADKMEELKETDDDILDKLRQREEAYERPGLETVEDTAESKSEILKTKRELAGEFTRMMNEAGELAERSNLSQELMSRELGDWLRETSQEGILEDMKEGELLVDYGMWEPARQQEEIVQEKLKQASDQLRQVASEAIENDLEGMQKALEQIDQLLEGEQGQRRIADARERSDKRQSAGQGPARRDREQIEVAQSETGRPRVERNHRASTRQSEPPDGQGRNPDDSPAQKGQPGRNEPPANQFGAKGSDGGDPPRDSTEGTEASDRSQGSDRDQAQAGRLPEDGLSPEARSGAGGGARGGRDRWRGAYPPDPRRFVDRDYRQWVDRLRRARALLPDDALWRERLETIRERIEAMESEYKRYSLAPKYDLFLRDVIDPLIETADQIDDEIQKILQEREFILTDDGGVPSKYRKSVSDYFQALADSEKAP